MLLSGAIVKMDPDYIVFFTELNNVGVFCSAIAVNELVTHKTQCIANSWHQGFIKKETNVIGH